MMVVRGFPPSHHHASSLHQRLAAGVVLLLGCRVGAPGGATAWWMWAVGEVELIAALVFLGAVLGLLLPEVGLESGGPGASLANLVLCGGT